jgi:hypothetical protein
LENPKWSAPARPLNVGPFGYADFVETLNLSHEKEA